MIRGGGVTRKSVRLVRLDTGAEFTIGADAIIWVDGEAREAGSITDPDTLVRVRDVGPGFLAALASGAPARSVADRPPVHFYELRGALVAPPAPKRPNVVPTVEQCGHTPHAHRSHRSGRTRGTVLLSHGPGWSTLRWPADAGDTARETVTASLPAEATIDTAGVFVRYHERDRALVVRELLAALSDVGFAVSTVDR